MKYISYNVTMTNNWWYDILPTMIQIDYQFFKGTKSLTNLITIAKFEL